MRSDGLLPEETVVAQDEVLLPGLALAEISVISFNPMVHSVWNVSSYQLF